MTAIDTSPLRTGADRQELDAKAGNQVRLAMLDGDGIGPEISAATRTVLEAAARRHGF